jgi:hypothetical protein
MIKRIVSQFAKSLKTKLFSLVTFSLQNISSFYILSNNELARVPNALGILLLTLYMTQQKYITKGPGLDLEIQVFEPSLVFVLGCPCNLSITSAEEAVFTLIQTDFNYVYAIKGTKFQASDAFSTFDIE